MLCPANALTRLPCVYALRTINTHPCRDNHVAEAPAKIPFKICYFSYVTSKVYFHGQIILLLFTDQCHPEGVYMHAESNKTEVLF